MKLIFLVLFTLLSCQKYAGFTDNDSLATIDNVKAEIIRADILEIKVGPSRTQEVSRGFLVEVGLNPIKEESAEALSRKFHVNSWLMRVRRVSGASREDIGYSYTPFFSQHIRLGKSFIKTKSISFRINYAAMISANLRNFNCPAYNHNLLIDDIKIIPRDFGNYSLTTDKPRPLNRPAEINKIVPPDFNGGLKLMGRYQVELALYNSDKKEIFGDWIPVNNIVEVSYESSTQLPGCVGAPDEMLIENKKDKIFPRNLFRRD